MRLIHLTLVPLAIGLLACTGICSGIGEKLGIGGDDGGVDVGGDAADAPEGFKCSAGAAAGGGLPDHGDGWWRFDGSKDDAGERLKKFWDAPSFTASMKTGDQQWHCDSGGQRSGPYLRLTDEPESWVSGYFESGDAHGTWKGGAGDDVGDDVAFEGHYSYGKKEGGWTFYDGDGEQVAQGGYHEDLAHGDWSFSSATAEHTYRYIHGLRHGLWKERDPVGKSLKTGAYFNGKKHGVWVVETIDEESGELVETGREVWENGTSRGKDGRNPLDGEDGAREVLRSYLDADLDGGRLSTAGFREYPVLSDFADATQFEAGDPVHDTAIITRRYTIKSVDLTGVTAKIKVEFEEVCEVAAGSSAKEVERQNEVEFTLKQQDGFWRLDTPATSPHPSARAYVDETGGLTEALGNEIRTKCGKDGGKGGKAGKAGGKGGKGGKAGGKGGKGGKAGRNQ